MRNKTFGKQLSRNRKSREALFVTITKAVIEHGSIATTLAKAQAVQPELERLMKLVSEDGLSAKRRAAQLLRNDRESVEKLFSHKAFSQSRTSGYTTIVKLPARRGDNAQLARIGWVSNETAKPAESEKSEKSQVASE